MLDCLLDHSFHAKEATLTRTRARGMLHFLRLLRSGSEKGDRLLSFARVCTISSCAWGESTYQMDTRVALWELAHRTPKRESSVRKYQPNTLVQFKQ